MPTNRQNRFTKRTSKRGNSYSASRIQTAWRKRNRKKTSLLARTAQSNRRAIKTLQKAPEVTILTSRRYQMLSNVQVNSTGTIGLTGTPVLMNLCGILPSTTPASTVPSPVGGGEYQRRGNSVTMKSISLKFKVQAESLADNNPDTLQQYVDVFIVLDRQPGNQVVTPTAMNLLQLTSDEGVTIDPGLRFYDTDSVKKTDRFSILMRKRLWVESRQNGTAVPPAGEYHTRTYPEIRYASHHLSGRYKLDYEADNIEVPMNQAILLLACSNVPIVVAPLVHDYPLLSVVARFRFIDP